MTYEAWVAKKKKYDLWVPMPIGDGPIRHKDPWGDYCFCQMRDCSLQKCDCRIPNGPDGQHQSWTEMKAPCEKTDTGYPPLCDFNVEDIEANCDIIANFVVVKQGKKMFALNKGK